MALQPKRSMTKFQFVIGRDGQVIGSKTENTATRTTTVKDRHGNVLGYGDARRGLTRDKSGNLVRWDGDPSFLLK